MKRRNFIFTTIFSLFTYKALIHSLSRVKKGNSGNLLITNAKNTCVTLKGGMLYELPEKPSEINSVIHFKVVKSKWSKSPTLDPKGSRIASRSGLLDVEKEININDSRNFTLQYINEEMGWIVLS